MEIKIYLANLGKYNEGELVGKWFTLPMDIEEMYIQVGVGQRLEDGTYKHGVWEKGLYCYEETAIHDYEAPFNISEYASLNTLNELAERLQEINGDDLEIILQAESNIDTALEILENGDYRIYTDCKDDSDLGYIIAEEQGLILDNDTILARYFDYESYGRDCRLEGNFTQIAYDTVLEIY